MNVARFLLMCVLVVCMASKYCGNSAFAQNDTASIRRLLATAEHVLNPDSAILLYDSAFKMSQSANYADGAFRAVITKGIKYFEKQDYAQYRAVSSDAIQWAEKCSEPDAVAWCLINIGEAWLSEGDYITASEYYYKALDDLNKRTEEITHTTVNIYNSLGWVHMRLGQYARAVAYHRMALRAAATAGLPYQLALSYESIGQYHLKMHQTDSATYYFDKELEVGKQMGKVDLQATSYARLGQVLIAAGKYRDAIPVLKKSVEMAQNRFQLPAVDAAYALAEAYRELHQMADAKKWLLEAYAETRAHHYRDRYETAYRQMAAFYKASGLADVALRYTDSLILIKDSLTSADNARTINHLEVRYKTAEKDRTLAENNLLIEKQNSSLARKNLMVWAVTGGVCLLLVLIIVLYRQYRRTQQLQREQIQSLQQQHTIGILRARIEGEERERERLARELHDGIGGMLSAAIMQLTNLQHHVLDAHHAHFDEGITLLKEIGAEVRKTSHNLMPGALLTQDLPDALIGLSASFMTDGQLSIAYQHYGQFNGISKEVKLNVYRIVQELLKNIVLHARAQHVLLQTEVHERLMMITVEDDGIGFDTQTYTRGLGLHNLEARVHALNGTCAIDTAPGKGTNIYIEIDLDSQKTIFATT